MRDFVRQLRLWLSVPRDYETVFRSFLRKLKFQFDLSSNELISGDSFKTECDFVVEGIVDKKEVFSKFRNERGRLFVQAMPDSNATALLIEACLCGYEFPEIDLVIHNGDVVPNEIEMKLLSESFQSIRSVNWLGTEVFAKPLPIGLENLAKLRNGIPKDYLREIERGLKSFDNRDIELLVCFSLWTNSSVRSDALNWAKEFPGAMIIDTPVTPRAYRKLVLRSKYVLSPPGNGPDCHRTWEALYLGATPIVLRDYWPFHGYDLPVISLKSWEELETRISFPRPTGSDHWREVANWLK
jgi:hypothetical protein